MLNKVGQVYLAVGVTDLRKAIDGLAIIVQEHFQMDPFSRNLYVFCNRKKDKLKILEWDHDGFWLHHKRLEKGRFQWPDGISEALEVDQRQFRFLLDGLSIHQKGGHREVKQRTII